VLDPVVTDIKIEPSSQTLVIGRKNEVNVIGLYSNGEKKQISEDLDLSIEGEHFFSIENGFIEGVGKGQGLYLKIRQLKRS
jgi:flagellar basal body rod protein FlgG